uniref:Glucosylceramidase n=1 Tax=Acrobeloides nanus TaxID=290746 RepID=A0A914BY75_9BILA
MKATNQFYGGGFNGRLKGDVNGPYYQTWAKYFVRFFEEYAKLGINFWGVTVQNEAVSGVTSPWAAMYMSAEMHSKFIRPNSTKIDMVIDRGNDRNDLDGVAFVTPTNQHVVVLQNRNMTTVYQVEIQDAEIDGKALQLEIEPRSIVTIVWNKIY